MRPKWAPEGLPGGVWAPWGPLGALLGRSWWSWTSLGALRAALGAVFGVLGQPLGPPGARLGLIWASRGAPFGALWASVERSLAKSREPRNSLTVKHLWRFFEVLGAPESPKIASLSLPGASGRLLAPLEAWLLGRPWVAPGPSGVSGPRAPHVTSSPKVV